MSGIASHERPNQGATNDWLTPQHVLDALGPFDLDPCASESNPTRVAPKAYTWRENGLAQPWDGFAFVNPPYGPHVGKWLVRLAEHGDGIALVFARTDTVAMQNALGLADAVLFLANRLTFVKPDGSRTPGNSGAPSMLLAFGDRALRRLGACALPGVFFEAYGRCEQAE